MLSKKFSQRAQGCDQSQRSSEPLALSITLQNYHNFNALPCYTCDRSSNKRCIISSRKNGCIADIRRMRSTLEVPHEIILLILEQIHCRHCLAKWSRTCKWSHASLTPRIWESLELTEWHTSKLAEGCHDRLPTDQPSDRCDTPLDSPPTSVDPSQGANITSPWPYLFTILSILLVRPSVARHVKHLKITHYALESVPRLSYPDHGSIDLLSMPAVSERFEQQVLKVIHSPPGDRIISTAGREDSLEKATIYIF